MKTKLFLSLLLCFSFLSPLYSEESIQEVFLKAPDLSDESIIGYSVGIRPYRKSGIRIEAERISNKLIIHNYGYGGSGLTLCFGGAQEVLSILNQEKQMDTSVKAVAVLGAGVIGLATAYDLLEKGYDVHIYADQFSPNLTSNVAAGIWSPPTPPKDASEQQKQLIARLVTVSTQRMLACATSSAPEFAGAGFHFGYSFKLESNSTKKVRDTFGDDAVSEKEDVIVHFDNGVTKKGTRKRALGLDGKLFMEDLYAKVIAKGAKIIHKQFSTISDIEKLEESVIVNCTSFGSQKLFNDQDFHPIRGHLVYFKPQPGVDYSLYHELAVQQYWTMLYPWSDRLILGGVYEEGIGNCILDKTVIDAILKYAREAFSNK